MSEINPFSPKESAQGSDESNVFLDLNKPDEATGVPAVSPGLGNENAGGGTVFVPGGAESSKFNGQVILAGLVFTIGVGAIYAMRYIGMQAGIKESVSMVEYTGSTNSPDFIKRFDSVMAELKEVAVTVQFDTSTTLPSSPFTLESVGNDEDVFTQPVTDRVDPNAQRDRLAHQRAEMARIEREGQVAEYEATAQELRLQSVIGGSRPVARISGEPVGVGMVVADTFTVLSINGSVVILEVDGIQFELGLGSGAKRLD